MPMAKGGKEHRSNITAQRYSLEASSGNSERAIIGKFDCSEDLGFKSASERRWGTAGAQRLLFTRLGSRLDLAKTERLQRASDLPSSSIFVAIHETSGKALDLSIGTCW